jgi:hypothetical protein
MLFMSTVKLALMMTCDSVAGHAAVPASYVFLLAIFAFGFNGFLLSLAYATIPGKTVTGLI